MAPGDTIRRRRRAGGGGEGGGRAAGELARRKEAAIATALEIAAVGLALAAIGMHLMSRAPAVRLAALALLLLSAILGWFAWSEGGGMAGP